jgi:hypothetical protein
MLHADSVTPQTRLAKNHQPLTGHDHFLDVMKIEPAQDERLAQRMGAVFLQSRLENLAAAAEVIEPRFDYFAAETKRLLAFLSWKPGELTPVLIAPRVMRKQVADRLDPEPPQLRAARARNPIDFA